VKTNFKLLAVVLWATKVTTAVLGQGTGNAFQTNFTWIAAGANIDLATSANWTPKAFPFQLEIIRLLTTETL